MTQTVTLPSLGESVDSGRVLSILVSEGDRIEVDDPILEIETDKASVEVPAQKAGVVASISVREGDDVETGQALLELEDEGDGKAGDGGDGGDEAHGGGEEAEDERDEEERTDGGEEEDREGDDRDGSGAGGDEQRRDAPEGEPAQGRSGAENGEPAARETDDSDEDDDGSDQDAGEQAGHAAGGDRETSRDQGGGAKGKGRRKSERKGRAKDADDDDGAGGAAPSAPAPERTAAPPRVRRLARELGVDLTEVAAADGARLTEEDLFSHVRDALSKSRGVREEEPELPDLSRFGEVERVPVGNTRRATAKVVFDSWRRIPQVTHFESARVARLEEARARSEAAGREISLTAILCKLVALGLRRFPRCNASYDARSGELVLRRSIHLGVAVETERGLLVPVLRDVGDKPIGALDRQLSGLLDAARSGDIRPGDLEGATFTISNVGSIGGSHFTPLVVWPQVAILGLGRIETGLVLEGGEVIEASRLPLSLSYDHRVLDGADAARFARWLREAIEEPMKVLLEAGERDG